MIRIALLLCLLPGVALAQPGPSLGMQQTDLNAALANYAPLSSLSNYALSSALSSYALTTALSNYATVASIPTPCATIPPQDNSPNGTVGSGNCYRRPSDLAPAAIQRANVTTATGGSWSVTWARSFVSTTPVIETVVINSGTLPIDCNVVSRSQTAASGQCWTAQSTTLGSTLLAVLGASVTPFAAAGAGVSVMVIGGEPTQ